MQLAKLMPPLIGFPAMTTSSRLTQLLKSSCLILLLLQLTAVSFVCADKSSVPIWLPSQVRFVSNGSFVVSICEKLQLLQLREVSERGRLAVLNLEFTEQSKLFRLVQPVRFNEERSLEKQVKISNLSNPLTSRADNWLLLHTSVTRFRQSDRFRLVRLFPSHDKSRSCFIPVKSSCESS